jgi:acyl-CoA thioesterase YciA
MTEKLELPAKHATLRVVPMPRDTNAAGDIFGGWIMSQVDIAGAIAASKRARGRVVTVAVNAFSFRQPVFVRDVVSFYAEVVKVGTTSITVDVEIYAERGFLLDKDESAIVKVTEATLTYVAVDASGAKRAVPAA